MNGKKKLFVSTTISCIFLGGIILLHNNASSKIKIDLSSDTISHVLSQTDSFVNEWTLPIYGELTPQSIWTSANSIVITYDNDFPNNYIILDVIIDRECSVARVKHISHSSKQNFDNISPLKYNLDFFIPKLNNLGIDLTSFYINKDSIHFSYEDGMPAGVCNTQSGEIKLFSE